MTDDIKKLIEDAKVHAAAFIEWTEKKLIEDAKVHAAAFIEWTEKNRSEEHTSELQSQR